MLFWSTRMYILGCQKDVIHHNDVIMSTVASQITSLAIVYSSIYSGADQRKHERSASLAFVRGIHQWPVNCYYGCVFIQACMCHICPSWWFRNTKTIFVADFAPRKVSAKTFDKINCRVDISYYVSSLKWGTTIEDRKYISTISMKWVYLYPCNSHNCLLCLFSHLMPNWI